MPPFFMIAVQVVFYALLGAMLFGGAIIAIGMFISSLTESPAVSAMVTLLVNVIMLFMDSLIALLPQPTGGTTFWQKTWENIMEFITGLLQKANLIQTFSAFSETIFKVTDVVYLLSVIFVFVFLSIRSLEKRRWS